VQLGSFAAVRPNYSSSLQCVDSAQPLAIGGGIHNTAQNKVRPAEKQGAIAFSSEAATASHEENAPKQSLRARI
jgi:hypothetical protein